MGHADDHGQLRRHAARVDLVSTFETVATTKRWFRVGVRGSNDTGQSSNVEMGTVSVEIDLQAR